MTVLGDPLILVQEASGRRHYLSGEAVRCGASIELQAVRVRSYDVHDNPIREPLDEWVPVRYEAALFKEVPAITLYADLGGHTAVIAHYSYMRFRWPETT